MKKKIKILNTEFANFGSIKNILKKIGHEGVLIDNFDDVEDYEKIILPGVGNFENIMGILKKKNLIENTKRKILGKKNKFLCICVGMQILFNSSEESKVPGLSIFPDKLVKINNPIVRVPHQGWNFAVYNKNNTTLKNIFEKKFYFSHSFWLQNFNEEMILTNSSYGDRFVSSIITSNILATQFHPEKSHGQGCDLIKYFSDEF